MGKTHRKQQILSARSRTTRSHKPRLLLSDPTESSAHLTAQLRALGLYAANTLGDGNCLFRALSDQLYGSHTKHSALRQAVCAFIEANKARYAPFCEDERGLDVHLRCMRENGTYGGHLELSAFAHMVKRNVKVVQPGLVYVIEWGAGLDEGEREVELGRRRKEEEREREREGLVMCVGTVYVAYHDWEHFSSIRNLNGPHAGLPNVVETPADDEDEDDEEEEEIPVRRDPKKERERERREKEKRDKMRRITKVKLKLSAPPSTTNTPPPEPAPAAMKMNIDTLSSLSSLSSLTSAASTPAPSPSPAPTSVPLSTISSSSSPPAAAPMLSTVAAAALPAFRVHRSPKRSFDESASSEDGQSVVSDDVERGRGRDKRSRMGSVVGAADLAAAGEVDGEVDGEASGEVDGEVDGGDMDGKVEEPPASQVSVGMERMEGVEGERERDSEEELKEEEEEDEEKEEAEVVAAIALGGVGGAAAQEIVDEGYSSLSSLSDSEDEDEDDGHEETPDGDDEAEEEAEGVEEDEDEEEEGQKDTSKATLKANGKKGKTGKGAMEKQVHLGEDGKPLTRKQRKQLGLPKFRGVVPKGVSAGRIVIPGGRFKGRAGVGAGVGVGGNVGVGGAGAGGRMRNG
ncbi:hypothetical protein D9611_000739 [Ephemerocybe angulata]|uniref:OTU domain-containing protein n=1 Tax=Ephemerocybe angulata TaxID=980116 RepID=A0A8H5BNG5_9AGAR|nr:hypothetical protein D9611_000739 [Tulosesus angulatus]